MSFQSVKPSVCWEEVRERERERERERQKERQQGKQNKLHHLQRPVPHKKCKILCTNVIMNFKKKIAEH